MARKITPVQKPLAKVASGGELSRVMLALKTILAESDHVPVLIFDEVDAGVGGAVAEVMGARLRNLSRHHQVLCVTHLPQVAACADQHCVVSKQRHTDSTTSTVTPINGPTRVTEIARMLGGEKLSDTTLAHAREMLSEQN